MLSNHLIFCSFFFCIQSFPAWGSFLMNWLNEYNELVLCNRWPKYWSFSFSISQSFQWINRADFLWGLTGCCHELFSSSEHYLPCIKRDIWMNWYLITSSKQCAKNTDVRDTRLKILNKQTNKKTIAEINCVLPCRYFVNTPRWFPYVYHFLDHVLKSLDKKTEEWKEKTAPP